MESYYDPKLWLVPSNTPFEKQIRKSNPDLGQNIELPKPTKALKTNEGLFGTGQIIPMKIRSRHTHDEDIEKEAILRKIKLTKARNLNTRQYNSFTETIGQKKAAYYRALKEKGLGERHARPVPGHPTVKFMFSRPEISEDELALCNLMTKTLGQGVISSFVPMCRPRINRQKGGGGELIGELRNDRYTLTPTYHSRKTHFILGGSDTSKPTTAHTNSSN